MAIMVTLPDGTVREATDEERAAFLAAVGESAAKSLGLLDEPAGECPATGETCERLCDSGECNLKESLIEGKAEEVKKDQPSRRKRSAKKADDN